MSPIDEFGSLPQARAYIDSVREEMGSLGARELIDALDRIDRAYREFPELALEQPCPCLTSILTRFPEYDGEKLVRLLGRFREIRWEAIEPVISTLRRRGRTDTLLAIVSMLLDRVGFRDKESAAGFGDLLADLLGDERPPEIDASAFTEFVRLARCRLERPALDRHQPGSREAVLAIAERLRAAPRPATVEPLADRAWPSGRLSFDEFLLQWPCEIELPAELDNTAFIGEAYRAILIRAPEAAESEQHLRLLHDGVVSREWVIEDLLASQELHSLERRLRVVCGGRVIVEPGSSGQENMPVVTWPSRLAG